MFWQIGALVLALSLAALFGGAEGLKIAATLFMAWLLLLGALYALRAIVRFVRR